MELKEGSHWQVLLSMTEYIDNTEWGRSSLYDIWIRIGIAEHIRPTLVQKSHISPR